MKKRAKIFIISFVIAFVAVVSFSLFFAGYEAEHDCVGVDCAICTVVSECRELLKQLCGGAKTVIGAAACCFFTALACCLSRLSIKANTPVSLKVKLSD